jgi:putative membrane protein
MTTEIALRYVHFLAVFAIFGTLTAEHMLLKGTLARAQLTRLARIDAGYGIAAGVLLAAGLTLWLGGYGKPAAFYSHNPVFHAKLGCFALVGLLSIFPTLFYTRHRKGGPDDLVDVPRSLVWTVRIQLLILCVMPLLAGLMAHGVGLRA